MIWRKNHLFVNDEIFPEMCIVVKHAIDENKTQTIHKLITDSNGDQKKSLLPGYNDPITLETALNMFLFIRLLTFVQNFHCLRVHNLITHFGRWILLCLLVQTYLRGLL